MGKFGRDRSGGPSPMVKLPVGKAVASALRLSEFRCRKAAPIRCPTPAKAKLLEAFTSAESERVLIRGV